MNAEADGPESEDESDAETGTEFVLREGPAHADEEFSSSDDDREPEYGSVGFEQSESESE